MIPQNIETFSLISAVQAAVLALMLWVGIDGDKGMERTSLRIRALALGLEALGWALLTAHDSLSTQMLLLGGNGVNLLAQALSVIAVRMLLGEPLRVRLVILVNLAGWLGVAWFGLGDVDYRMRVLWGSVAIAINMLLTIEALLAGWRRGTSRARYVLMVIALLAIALLVWRNGQLWFGIDPPDRISVPGSTNAFYVMFSGMQPLFASIAFLLLYNEILQKELHKLARVDPLTDVNNRLAIGEATARLLAQAQRNGQPLGVMMLDADHFKSVNDQYGHAGGDRVLQALVANVRRILRDSDEIGRIGGEEFVVLSPGADIHGMRGLGERVRQIVESAPLTIDGVDVQLTVSVGVTVALPGEDDVPAILQRTDKALYAAKRAGRNRVMVCEGHAAGGNAATPVEVPHALAPGGQDNRRDYLRS